MDEQEISAQEKINNKTPAGRISFFDETYPFPKIWEEFDLASLSSYWKKQETVERLAGEAFAKKVRQTLGTDLDG